MILLICFSLSLLLLPPSLQQSFDQCNDAPYFYYKCSQLAKYCKYPQAFRIRKSCPITCGVCSPNGGFEGLSSNLIDNNDDPMKDDKLVPVIPASQKRLQPVVPYRDRSVWMQRAANQLASPKNNTAPFGHSLIAIPTPSTTDIPLFTPRPFLETTQVNRIQPNTQFNTRRPSTIDSRQFSTTPAPVSVTTVVPAKSIPSGKLNDQQANDGLLACCKRNKISAFCEPLCSYKTSKSEILKRAVSGSCTIDDAKLWVRCASGDQQNAPCCRKHRVKSCDQMCNGKFPSNFNALLNCVNRHLPKILKCHKDSISIAALNSIVVSKKI